MVVDFVIGETIRLRKVNSQIAKAVNKLYSQFTHYRDNYINNKIFSYLSFQALSNIKSHYVQV